MSAGRQPCPCCHRAVVVYAPIIRVGDERLARAEPPMFRKHRVRPRYGPLCPGSYTFVGVTPQREEARSR